MEEVPVDHDAEFQQSQSHQAQNADGSELADLDLAEEEISRQQSNQNVEYRDVGGENVLDQQDKGENQRGRGDGQTDVDLSGAPSVFWRSSSVTLK